LHGGLAGLPGVELPFRTQANAVFARLPQSVMESLWSAGRKFYTEVGPGDCARLKCSWDTTEADVDGLITDISAGVVVR